MAARPGLEFRFEVETEAVKDGRGDVGRFDRAIRGDGPYRVAGSDHAASLNAAAGEADREAERPVITSAGGVHAGRTPEFRQVAHECRIKQTRAARGPQPGRCKPGRTSGKRCHAYPRSK